MARFRINIRIGQASYVTNSRFYYYSPHAQVLERFLLSVFRDFVINRRWGGQKFIKTRLIMIAESPVNGDALDRRESRRRFSTIKRR